MRFAVIVTVGSIAGALAIAPSGARADVTCEYAPEALRGAFAHNDDCFFVSRVTRLTLETARVGSPASTWKNPRSGASGTMQVLANVPEGGRVCRTFKMSVTVSGKTTEGRGKACRVGDAWQLAT